MFGCDSLDTAKIANSSDAEHDDVWWRETIRKRSCGVSVDMPVRWQNNVLRDQPSSSQL